MDLTCKVHIKPCYDEIQKLWTVSAFCTEFWKGMLTQRKNPHLYGETNKY